VIAFERGGSDRRGGVRRTIGLAAVLTLAGCAHAPEPAVQVQRIEVPVPVKCAVAVDRPTLADTAEALMAAPDIFALARLIMAGRIQRDAYIAKLEAAASGCR